MNTHDAMFSWKNNEPSEVNLSGLRVAPLGGGCPFAKFDITLNLFESDERIAGALEYATALFDRATIERYFGCLTTQLTAMVADEG